MEAITDSMRGVWMTLLPILAFAVGIAIASYPDDTLRRAVINKNWESAPTVKDEKKAPTTEADKAGTGQTNPAKKDDG